METKDIVQSVLKVAVYGTLIVITAWIEFWLPYSPRFFREQDPDLSFPKVSSTYSQNDVILMAYVGVMVVLSVCHFAGLLGKRLPLFTLLVAFSNGMLVQAFSVNVLKLWCGRLRPNFYALCNYQGFADVVDWNNSTNNAALSSYMEKTTFGAVGDFANCLNEDHAKGHHSFPSGAAAWAFAGFGFLGMMLVAIVKRKGGPGSMQILAFMPPIAFAGWISATRIREFAHREEDVAVACIIGLVSTYWAYLSLPPLDGKEEVDEQGVALT